MRALVSHALPNISVKVVIYPKFETRGDLHECVGRFVEWYGWRGYICPSPNLILLFTQIALQIRLQNVIIDIEVSASTPSPTIDPSVRTILIGHSMGGIVAADALLRITSDAPIPPSTPTVSPSGIESKSSQGSHAAPLSPNSSNNSFMFPYVQGILAFDTPYLGISPSVIAHGAESQYKTASSAFSTLGEVASAFGWGTAASKSATPAAPQQRALPAPPSDSARNAMAASMTAKGSDAAAVPAWQRWGKYAMFAGAAGAVAAGGAAAYLKRDSITEGWTWVGSHLEFVGCLMRGEELKSRLERVMQLQEDNGIGFKDLITVLGKGSRGKPPAMTLAGGFVEVHGAGGASGERTFCNVPKSERNRKVFEKLEIEEAADEMVAHCSIFLPQDHRGYYGMSERVKKLVVKWVEPGWYESSQRIRRGGRGGVGKGDEDASSALGDEEPVLVS